MQTIFITSFHAHVSRNILATPVLDILKSKSNLRVVILAPNYKINYFKEKFAGGNVIVEGASPNQASKQSLGLLFKKLGIFLFDSDTTRLKLRYKLYKDKKFFYFIFFFLAGRLGNFFWFRRLIRFFDFHFSPKGFFKEILDKYNPALVFATDIQNENDVSLMQDAKAAGIPILGMVRSWDNMTQRVFRVMPDRLLVGSQEIFNEVKQSHCYPNDQIITSGYPYYDKYLRAPINSKTEFFLRFGLNPNRRLILYIPIGDDIMLKNDVDRYVVGLLGTVDSQVLVRLPTNLNLNLENFSIPKNVVFDKPGFGFRDVGALDQEITKEDDERLIDSLFYSDVVVAGPTSVCLDAALLNKPVVAVNFCPTTRTFFEGLYHYEYVHLKKLTETGGLYVTKNPNEFFAAIDTLFKNPKLGDEGRKKIKALWFSHADGAVSKRVADEIFKFIY